MIKYSIFFIFVLFYCSLSFSDSKHSHIKSSQSNHDHNHEHKEHTNHEDEDEDHEFEGYFSISKESEKLFQIRKKLIKRNKSCNYLINKESLVFFKNQIGFFVVRKNFYHFLSGKTLFKKNNFYKIKSCEVKDNDEIITSGVSFLRVVYLNESGGQGQAHSH